MITLSEKEKRTIAAIVQERIDEHLERFPYARYPVEPLEEWCKIFSDPASVPPETIKKALGWHFGGWQRQSLPPAVSRTIAAILKGWSEFLPLVSAEPQEIFSSGRDNSQIGAPAFRQQPFCSIFNVRTISNL
ncbi:hypothetical protein [Paenibacillus sp. S150]|uniref:hypothetical protein n=1 Tax=Paenibacillus sp. S150 TaxID=2749826 RepID=UPI001C559945|nr:hypothetical protein [Paenibacillus sp. S150]MBW4083650.1 hypothetical protein [Paenibacillus sp. S150]